MMEEMGRLDWLLVVLVVLVLGLSLLVAMMCNKIERFRTELNVVDDKAQRALVAATVCGLPSARAKDKLTARQAIMLLCNHFKLKITKITEDYDHYKLKNEPKKKK